MISGSVNRPSPGRCPEMVGQGPPYEDHSAVGWALAHQIYELGFKADSNISSALAGDSDGWSR